MEKINSNNKNLSSRREFVKKVAKGVAIGAGAYATKKIYDYIEKIKSLKEDEKIDFISKEIKQTDIFLNTYEKFYDNLIKELDSFVVSDEELNKMSFIDKQEYFLLLNKYQKKLNLELERIDYKIQRIDFLLKEITEIKNEKKLEKIEKSVIKKGFSLYKKTIEIEKNYLTYNLKILNQIEKLIIILRPNTKLA
jgi:hypothetical protein